MKYDVITKLFVLNFFCDCKM